ARVRDVSPPRGLAVAADRNHGPVIRNDLDPDARGLFDVVEYVVERAVAVGAGGEGDVVGVHANGFDGDAAAVAIVAHLLEVIEVPAIAKLDRQVLDAIAQVEIEVLRGRDSGAGDGMIIAADVHEQVL